MAPGLTMSVLALLEYLFGEIPRWRLSSPGNPILVGRVGPTSSRSRNGFMRYGPDFQPGTSQLTAICRFIFGGGKFFQATYALHRFAALSVLLNLTSLFQSALKLGNVDHDASLG